MSNITHKNVNSIIKKLLDNGAKEARIAGSGKNYIIIQAMLSTKISKEYYHLRTEEDVENVIDIINSKRYLNDKT